MKNNYKYIICDNNKAPVHKFEDYKTYEDVKDKENLGIIIENPYVIIDFNTENEFNIMCNIIKKLGLKTRILKKEKGGHFWFKSSKPITNAINFKCPLTLDIDVKSWSKRSMLIVKEKGVWKKWVQRDVDVDELPKFLTPMRTEKKLLGLSDNDSRNDELYSFILPLVKLGLNKKQVKETYTIINNYIFAKPLDECDIDNLLENNNVFNKPEIVFFDGKTFLHDKFADYLIEELNIKYYGKSLYFFDGRAYVDGDDLLKAKMVEKIPFIRVNQIKETFENIKFKSMITPQELDTRYINVKNGLLDIRTKEIIPHSPDYFIINKLNVEYNPDEINENIDKLLVTLSDGNSNTINLLTQMIGYVLTPDCRYQKSFILLGNGSNGKSLFLDVVRNLIGDSNCSSLALEDLSEKFRIAEICDKLLNIGDDSGHGLLNNTAIFKKLVSGDSITIERKNQQPFKFINTAKMIFAANTLPPTTDKSNGFFRRCVIINFNHVFTPGDADYDPNIIYKVTTESAKSRLLNIALAGLDKLIANNKFEETDESEKALKQYAENNNNVLVWFENINREFFTDADAYSSYVFYCTSNNYRPVNIGKFKLEYDRLKLTKM